MSLEIKPGVEFYTGLDLFLLIRYLDIGQPTIKQVVEADEPKSVCRPSGNHQQRKRSHSIWSNLSIDSSGFAAIAARSFA